jgi:hypothetical protein
VGPRGGPSTTFGQASPWTPRSVSRPATGRDSKARAKARPCLARPGRNAWRDHRGVSRCSTHSLPTPLPDGQTVLSLTPMEFLGHLPALVSPPRRQSQSVHGVLAPTAPTVLQGPPAQGPMVGCAPERRPIALSSPHRTGSVLLPARRISIRMHAFI